MIGRASYDETQIRTFTRWTQRLFRPKGITINNIVDDFQDGVNLIILAEILTHEEYKGKRHLKPRMDMQKAENCGIAINLLQKNGFKFIGIGGSDFVEKNVKLVLGFFWTLIMKAQIDNLKEDNINSKNAILMWAQKNTAGYEGVNITDLHISWKSGLGFCALINKFRPDILKYDEVPRDDPKKALEMAFSACEQIGIPVFLDVEDLNCTKPDEKSVMMQLAEMMMFFKSTLAIGIDIGSDKCRFGVFRNNCIDTNNYHNIFDSALSIRGNEINVGKRDEEAISIDGMMRIIGCNYKDPRIASTLNHLPFNVTEDPNTHCPVIEIPTGDQINSITPGEVVKLLLKKVQAIVKYQNNEEIVDCVISVPSMFSSEQRQAVIEAGKAAGMNVMRLLDEPLASALSLSISDENASDEKKQIVMLDMGAGKTDVSLIQVDGKKCTTLRTAGSASLGGMDINFEMIDKFQDEIKNQTGVEIKSKPMLYQKISNAAEKMKVELTSNETSRIDIHEEGLDFSRLMTRDEINKIADPIINKAVGFVDDIFKDKQFSKEDVKDVYVVGKLTKMPKMTEKIIEKFPDQNIYQLDSDKSILDGTIIQAAKLKGDKSELIKDIETRACMPLSISKASISNTPFWMIKRGTPYPYTFEVIVVTAVDNQEGMNIKFYEGERLLEEENNLIGEIVVTGLPKARHGEAKVNLKFSVDENGIIDVKCVDQNTKAVFPAVIKSKVYTEEEIARMISNAEKNFEQDQVDSKVRESRTELEYLLIHAKDAEEYPETISNLGSRLQEYIDVVSRYQEWLNNHKEETADSYIDMKKRAFDEINSYISVS